MKDASASNNQHLIVSTNESTRGELGVMSNVIHMSSRGRHGDEGAVPSVTSAEVRALNLELESWQLHGLETESPEHITTQLMPQASKLLQRARDLLRSVDSDHRDSGAYGARPDDIAFFALRELSCGERQLARAAADGTPWRVVEVCEQMRGQLMNACSALLRALSQRMGVEVVDEVREREIARAIRVRRRLASFRAGLSRGARTAGDDVFRQMRLAGAAVAKLIGADEYEDFRLSDRMLVSSIQRDILTWVASGREARDARRVWEDLMNFVELSQGVNHNVQLAEHDERALAGLASSLAGRPAHEALSSELQPVVRSLWGLHPRLDALIECDEPRTAAEWRGCIRDLQSELRTSVESSPIALAAGHA